MGRWQSGQLHWTVNPTPSGYIGSNPFLPTGANAHMRSKVLGDDQGNVIAGLGTT